MKRICLLFLVFVSLLPLRAQVAGSLRVNASVRDFADALRAEYGAVNADGWLQYAPGAFYLGMGACGGAAGFAEHFAVTATSWAAVGIMVNVLKYTVREERPDGTKSNSFPSGHSATAFMGAELVRMEYGGWYGAGAYAAAAAVGAMRIYNGRHWLTDVLAGAGIGVLSAHVGRMMLPLERKWFGIGARGSLVVLPFTAPSPVSGAPAAGMSLACTF